MKRPNDDILREFRRSDLLSVQELILRTIDISLANVYPPSAIRHFKAHHADEEILADAQEGYTVVLERDGIIIGTGTLVGKKVTRAYVAPELQGQGLGKRIMSLLEERAEADGLENLFLYSSVTAKRFYESLGYGIEAEKSDEMEDGKHLEYLEMIKHLKGVPG